MNIQISYRIIEHKNKMDIQVIYPLIRKDIKLNIIYKEGSKPITIGDNNPFENNNTPLQIVLKHTNRLREVLTKTISAPTDGFDYNNILSAPGGNLEGLFNYFEIGDGYKYDTDKMQEDISNYGLFTYEEFYNQLPDEIKEFMTEELF